MIILYFDTEKYKECIKLSEKYLEYHPGDSRILLIQSDALLKTGDTKKSGEILSKIVTEDPGFTVFANKMKKNRNIASEKDFFTNVSSRAEKKLHEFESKKELNAENPEDFAAPSAQDAMDLSLLYLFNGETEKALEYLLIAKKSVEGE